MACSWALQWLHLLLNALLHLLLNEWAVASAVVWVAASAVAWVVASAGERAVHGLLWQCLLLLGGLRRVGEMPDNLIDSSVDLLLSGIDSTEMLSVAVNCSDSSDGPASDGLETVAPRKV